MAIDTAAKRASIMNFSLGDRLTVPSGTVTAGERLTFLDLYSGIAADPPPTPSSIKFRGGMRMGMWLGLGGLASGTFPG